MIQEMCFACPLIAKTSYTDTSSPYVLASWTLPFAQRGMFDFVQQTDDKLMTEAKVFFLYSQKVNSSEHVLKCGPNWCNNKKRI